MIDPREYCFYCMNQLPAPDAVCPVCGKDNRIRQNGNSELPFARLAGKYIVGRALGRGGFGVTYVGLNEKLGKRVAIKEYFPADISERSENRMEIRASSSDTDGSFEKGKQKALAEARFIAQVNSVPNVVRIYDCFSRSNTVYIIMEYIEGEDLQNVVAGRGALKWQEAWGYMKPIARALDSLHRQNLIHRDISPDNIMIRKDDGVAVLLDFGAAGQQQKAGEKHTKLLKDGYAAPEQYTETAAINGRSDEYAWCATLYYLLTGVRPPNPAQRRYDEKSMKLPRKLHSDIPAEAQAALMRGISLDPEERYPTMKDLVEAIEGTAEQGEAEESKSQKAPWGIGRKMTALASALLAAAGVLMVCLGLQAEPAMVMTIGDTTVYNSPTGDTLSELGTGTYLCVQASSRMEDKTWYKVSFPENDTLKVGYVMEQDTQEVDSETRLQLLNLFRASPR